MDEIVVAAHGWTHESEAFVIVPKDKDAFLQAGIVGDDPPLAAGRLSFIERGGGQFNLPYRTLAYALLLPVSFVIDFTSAGSNPIRGYGKARRFRTPGLDIAESKRLAPANPRAPQSCADAIRPAWEFSE